MHGEQLNFPGLIFNIQCKCNEASYCSIYLGNPDTELLAIRENPFDRLLLPPSPIRNE